MFTRINTYDLFFVLTAIAFNLLMVGSRGFQKQVGADKTEEF